MKEVICMINKLHGKYYYIEVPSAHIGNRLVHITTNYPIFSKRAIIFCVKYIEGKWCVVPVDIVGESIPVGAFRGELYSSYERFKEKSYKIIKEES